MTQTILTAFAPLAVADGGTITFAYPAGKVAADFVAAGSVLTIGNNITLEDGHLYDVTLGVSNVTVELDGIDAPALSVVRLGLEAAVADDGDMDVSEFDTVWKADTLSKLTAVLAGSTAIRVLTDPEGTPVTAITDLDALAAYLGVGASGDEYPTTMTTSNTAVQNGAALTADIIAAQGRPVVIPTGAYNFGGGSIGTAAVDIVNSEALLVHLKFAKGAVLTCNTVGVNSTNVFFWFREGVYAIIDGGEFNGGSIAEIFARTTDSTASPGGELEVRNAKIHNFGWKTADGGASSAGTIGILLNNGKRLVVDNCQMYNFRSRENGTYSDQPGKCSFIQWFNASSGQQNPCTYSITNCEFDAGAEDNEGDDYDHIHFLQQAPLANINGVIDNCRFKFHGKARRVLKYQGGGVHFLRNSHIEPTSTCLPSTTGQTSIVITAATEAAPGVFTTGASHAIPYGTPLKLSAMAGGTWGTINAIEYLAVPVSATTFNLFGPVAAPLDTSGLGAYTANTGVVARVNGQGQTLTINAATAANPGVFTTRYGVVNNPHGFVTGDLVRFRSMAGGTWSTINDVDYWVEVIDATTFRVFAVALLNTSALGTYTASSGSLTRVNGVTNEGMAGIDWAGANSGRLEISDCYLNLSGMRNGIVQSTGKGASIICRDSTIIGNRYDSNRFIPDSGANEVGAPIAFSTNSDDVDSALVNCDVYGWARGVFPAGKNNVIKGNRFFDPRTHWIQVGTTVRDGLIVEDNMVITRTPYSLNASTDGVTADFARCGEIRNWTNVKVNRNTLRREGNTLHGTRFIAFIVNGVTGEALGNRVLPEGTACHAINYSSGVAPINSLTATAVAGAVTLNAMMGKITTEALTTAAAAAYTLTITNDRIVAVDHVYVSIANGTNSAGVPIVSRVTCAAGSVAIVISNEHAANAFNGTLIVSFKVEKA